MSVLPKFLVVAFKMKKAVITITLQPDSICKRLSCLFPALSLYPVGHWEAQCYLHFYIVVHIQLLHTDYICLSTCR